MEINEGHAKEILRLCEFGVVSGLGNPEPGKMCIEAIVCYALGLPHGDDPGCVAQSLRLLKIKLNDANWSSPAGRASGLRRLAVAQLGSAGQLDEREFSRRVIEYTIGITVSCALRSAASIHPDANHQAAMLMAAERCKTEKSVAAAYAASYAAADAAKAAADAAADAAKAAAYAATDAADAVAYAADAAAYAAADAAAAAAYAAADAAADAAKIDDELSIFAEGIVQILIAMNAPGCQWLDLVEEAA
jgi:hypothetical protein